MSRIRGRDTAPEMIVRRLVHAMGFRYRLHVRALPGTPDLVFPGRRMVVLVHGCFWHRHRCRLGRPVPATRRGFWEAKFHGNVCRDARHGRALRRLGWRVLTVWQCETTPARRARLAARLARFLGEA